MSLATSAILGNGVRFDGEPHVGHQSYVGYPNQVGHTDTTIGSGAQIGSFCLIESGCTIGNDVEISDYVGIANGVVIGNKTKILEKVHVHARARIGRECIVGGDLAERTILEDFVTFMGEIAHSHRHPTSIDAWDVTDEPSPIIREGSVIGVRALLVGGVEIGPRSYIGAGEVVRFDIPPDSVLYNGRISALSSWRGIIRART